MKATENLELPRCALRLCYWPRNLTARRPGCQCRPRRGRPHCQGRVLTQVTIQGPATAVCKGQVPQSPVMVRYNDRDNAAPGPAGWPWAVAQTPGHWQNAPQAQRGRRKQSRQCCHRDPARSSIAACASLALCCRGGYARPRLGSRRCSLCRSLRPSKSGSNNAGFFRWRTVDAAQDG